MSSQHSVPRAVQRDQFDPKTARLLKESVVTAKPSDFSIASLAMSFAEMEVLAARERAEC